MKKNSYAHWELKIDQLCDLINARTLGTAESLGKRIKISRRAVFRYFEEFEKRGAKLKYNRKKKLYYFEEPFTTRWEW